MTKAAKIRLIYGICLSVLTVVVGVLFIVETANIYYSGKNGDGTPIYSRELVSQHLGLLMIPLSIWLAAIIVGFVLSLVYRTKETSFVKKGAREVVSRLADKLQGMSLADNEQYRQYRKLNVVRIVIVVISGVFCLISAVFCCVYLFNTAHFPAENITAEVLQMLRNVLPWVIAAFVVCIAAFVGDMVCAKKQLPLVKQMLASNGGGSAAKDGADDNGNSKKRVNSKVVWIVRGVVFAVAITFIVLGALNGGARDMLLKAINICAECIGLG